MPTTDPPARNWWSLSKQPSGRDLHHNFVQADEKHAKRSPNAVKSPSGFKSLASAIGLKSKKHQQPSLAIQEPPSPLVPQYHHAFPASPSSDIYSAGPASSTRSRVDSLEPPTPVDSHRDKINSLLTIADDPFAGRSPMIALPVAHSPADPSRLSAYSGPPVNEFLHGKVDPPTFNRVSYASTSSNSHTPNFDSAMMSSPPHAFPQGNKLRPKRSAGSMQASIPDRLTREPSIAYSNSRWSPTTNTAKSVMEEVVPSRPKQRARGMTDGGHPQMAGFFVREHPVQSKASTKPQTSTLPPLTTAFESLAYPRVIVRQASSSRLHAPPTAPPSHSLPATPHSPVDHPNPRQRKGLEESLPGSASASSSSVSLADEYATASFPFHDKRGSSRSYFSHSAQESIMESFDSHSKDTKTVPSSPRSLKKALSQSSLRRAAAPCLSKAASDQPIDQRKQPKFHHPRLPIPPIPLMRPSTSSGTPFPSNGDPGPSSESRRGSTSSRKRLFSGGSNARPSTASSIVYSSREDDATSLFSLRSDNEICHAPYRPWAVTTNFPKPQAAAPSNSFWDEEPEAAPSSPTHTHSDYLPQAIMSRDQLAKLEASVENMPERPFRSRGFSQTSASTMASSSLSSVMDELDLDNDRDTDTVLSASGLSPPPSTKPSKRPTSARASSTRTLSVISAGPRRPSTADVGTRVAALSVPEDAVRPPSSTASTLTMRPPSIHEHTSLPPPPRPRLRSTTSTRSNSSAKTIDRPYHVTHSNSPRHAFIDRPSPASSPNTSPLIPAAIPASLMRAPSLGVRKSKGSLRSGRTKPPVVLEKTIHRRSLMRKPSFLEIDGDTDAESDSDVLVEKRDSLFIGLRGPIAPIIPGPIGMASSGHGHGAVGAARTGESFLDFARESFDTLRT